MLSNDIGTLIKGKQQTSVIKGAVTWSYELDIVCGAGGKLSPMWPCSEVVVNPEKG